MPQAIWKGAVLADSDQGVTVEGNYYFPRASLDMSFFAESDTRTTCHWKGVASYFHVRVNDETNQDAAWFYLEPKDAAAEIKDHVAFWRGVEVG